MAEPVDKSYEWPPFCSAVLSGDVGCVEAAAAIAELEWQDAATAVHISAITDFSAAVLVAAGARVNSYLEPDDVPVTETGMQACQVDQMRAACAQTALEKAVVLGHIDTVRALLAAGALVRTAHLGVLQLLLAAGQDEEKVAHAWQLGAVLVEGCLARAANPAAAAAEPWDMRYVGAALPALLSSTVTSSETHTDQLRLLLKANQDDWLSDQQHTEEVACLATTRPFTSLNTVALCQLWMASPPLRRQPLIKLVAMAALKGSKKVVACLCKHQHTLRVVRDSVAWDVAWRERYEEWSGRCEEWTRRSAQAPQLDPRPPFEMLGPGADLPDKQGWAPAGAAMSRRDDILQVMLKAGYRISVHSLNLVCSGNAEMARDGVPLLFKAAGRLLPVPRQLACVSWCPIYALLESHVKMQQNQAADVAGGTAVVLGCPHTDRQAIHLNSLRLMECLLGAGYRPTQMFDSVLRPDGSLEEGVRPLEAPPASWEVDGRNRYLWLTARHVPWLPETHRHFPPAVREAVRLLLLVSHRPFTTSSPVKKRSRKGGWVVRVQRRTGLASLPPDLVCRIMEHAAYPLSAWSPPLVEEVEEASVNQG